MAGSVITIHLSSRSRLIWCVRWPRRQWQTNGRAEMPARRELAGTLGIGPHKEACPRCMLDGSWSLGPFGLQGDDAVLHST